MLYMYIVIIVFYMKVDLIINDNKQELMIIKELFEGPVADYCIARNTIKCLLFYDIYTGLVQWQTVLIDFYCPTKHLFRSTQILLGVMKLTRPRVVWVCGQQR